MTSYDGSRDHRIRKLVFDFRYPDEATAFLARRRLEDLAGTATIPALEKVLDAFESGPREVRIDRLELDLGRMSAGALDGGAIGKAIAEQLGRKLQAAAAGETVPSTELAPSLEALIAFLRSGFWPWDAPFRAVEDVESALMSLAPPAAQHAAARLLAVLQESTAAKRLIYQLSAGFPEWIVRSAYGEDAETLIGSGREAADTTAPEQFALALLAVSSALRPGQPVVLEQVQDLWAAALRPAPVERAEPAVAIPPAGEKRGARERPKRIAPPDELYVAYAGIVLLHPFLPRFFERLGLLDERQRFASPDACVRGVHLLHYLAAGREHPDEPTTVLFKILCGLPIAFPLPRQLPLADSERDEAESLLSAVIGHWTKLGNTSPAGLREAFLQREGKLTSDERGWRLVVEQRSADVLLGYLPWGLSVVRLPWVITPLRVDWA